MVWLQFGSVSPNKFFPTETVSVNLNKVSAGNTLFTNTVTNWSQTKHLVQYVPFPDFDLPASNLVFSYKCAANATVSYGKLVLKWVLKKFQFQSN